MQESISIIIPTFNEAEVIQSLVHYLVQEGKPFALEIIVSDGGSKDGTLALAREAGGIGILSPKRGRAAQMNAAAIHATGTILYFLHADTYPPPGFLASILENCTKTHGAGCFRLRFDNSHWFLKVNAWFTRFDVNSVRFGDQSLYMRKEYFNQIGGFREDHILMEDQEIIGRIKKVTGFKILPFAVTTSAKKYLANGVYRLQFIFSSIWLLYYLGLPQSMLVKVYNKLIRMSKLKD